LPKSAIIHASDGGWNALLDLSSRESSQPDKVACIWRLGEMGSRNRFKTGFHSAASSIEQEQA